MELYLRKVSRVPEISAEVLYRLGDYYLSMRSSAVNGVRARLAKHFGASSQCKRLEEKIRRVTKR